MLLCLVGICLDVHLTDGEIRLVMERIALFAKRWGTI